MLEITHGQAKNQIVADQLIDQLVSLDLDGSLYIGYPVLATAEESVTVDALLVTVKHGLVAFIFDEPSSNSESPEDIWYAREERQDQLFIAVENNLRRYRTLLTRRRLAVIVRTIMVMTHSSKVPQDIEGQYASIEDIPGALRKFGPMDSRYLKPLQAALQRVTTIRPPKKRASVSSPKSKGAILKRLESEIANLDQWQKHAAIESPQGPQRIRGLAGSGKTIVLALKAAYLHALNPTWRIAVTFSTRALYQQFEDLVRRFSFEHSNDEPNWTNLQILHAWGGRHRDGLYQQVALHCGQIPRDFLYAKSRYGMDGAFEGVCSELLLAMSPMNHEPMYDAVIIDEAQDFSESFFQLVYKMTKEPKRIIWAYDELQNLSNSSLPTIDQQFGTNTHGESNISLLNTPHTPQQDIVLPVCYRNTPWALALAHGLGLGTSRADGLVQSFDDPSLWIAIGYRLVDGSLQKGRRVSLERAPNSYPDYLPDLIQQNDAVSSHVFDNAEAQAQWIARSIQNNLTEDELEHDDILIVVPDAYTSRSQAGIVLDALDKVGIAGHLVGVTTSQDEIFKSDSIAIANIYRSKGNESPMVYIINAQHCMAAHRLATVRNILFTAITRSKAWVRICGWGSLMTQLQDEIASIRSNNFRLTFNLPSDDELENMRQIHRDLTPGEKAKVDELTRGLRNILESLDRGDISKDDLPPDLRDAVARRLGIQQ